MQSKSSRENPNPNAAKMASHFLRSLARINAATASSNPAQRNRRIKRAAYASMVLAAGARRAWSRALIRRLRSRAGRRLVVIRRANTSRRIGVSSVRRPTVTTQSPADVLRDLVPGGRAMDFCSLLEETASYARCLAAQVRLMQTVADSLSL